MARHRHHDHRHLLAVVGGAAVVAVAIVTLAAGPGCLAEGRPLGCDRSGSVRSVEAIGATTVTGRFGPIESGTQPPLGDRGGETAPETGASRSSSESSGDRGLDVIDLGRLPDDVTDGQDDGTDQAAGSTTTSGPHPKRSGASDRGGQGSEKTVVTSGSGLAAVTTVPASAAAEVDIYRGKLGRWPRDQWLTAGAGPQPTARAGTLPLTGLPGDVPQRPAAVVKIDNSERARPQVGLNAADIVVEEEVEGGITRLAAIFHSQSSIVGPVRSARTTDIGIVNSLGSPLLLYSGANSVTDAFLLAQPTVQNRSAARSSGYWRARNRRSPSNLFSDTDPHWRSASGGPPPAQFHYRSAGQSAAGDHNGTEAPIIEVTYNANRVSWSWDGANYLRSQNGSAHLTEAAGQVSAANVVVVEAEEIPTGMVDSSGATVPEFVFAGTGRAVVFTNGRRYEGTWTRSRLAEAAVLTVSDGTLIRLTPGRTWIELVGAGSGALR